jgi:PhnB protein
MTMTYGDAPEGQGMPATGAAKDLVMHTSMPLGSMTLMGCDAHPQFGTPGPINGVRISVDDADEAKVTQLFDALAEGGRVDMPLAKTFWSPWFGMCTDKFGVEWMLSVPGPPM